MTALFQLIYPIISALWRDCFGKDGWGLPIIKYRVVQHIFLFIVSFALLICRGTTLALSAWIALGIQVWWSLGHGPAYDIGTAGKPDAKMLKRYKKMVGYKLLCKLFPEDKWYSFGFDFALLAIRYTYPLVLICWWFNPVFLTLGLVVASLYAIYKHCEWLQKQRWADVELWVGFVAGLFIAYL